VAAGLTPSISAPRQKTDVFGKPVHTGVFDDEASGSDHQGLEAAEDGNADGAQSTP
jgi:hypothetical protein